MEIIGSEVVYDRHFKIVKYVTKDDEGNQYQQECFERGDAVAAIVHDVVKHKFLFTKQFRIGAKKELIEIVAGTMDVHGESPEEAIEREIMEELGYETDSLIKISSDYVSPGGTSEMVHIFFAEVSNKIANGGGIDDEKITTIEMSPEEIIDLSQFTDAKTKIALLWVINESLKIRKDNDLIDAFNELLDAPHQEHFVVRFNDEETVAFEKMKAALDKIQNPVG